MSEPLPAEPCSSSPDSSPFSEGVSSEALSSQALARSLEQKYSRTGSISFDPRRLERSSLARWDLNSLAGRWVEIVHSSSSPTPSLTIAASLIAEAQRQGELAAWVSGQESLFFPPDFDQSGIDLEALPVIRVQGVIAAARATESILRSGSFSLILMDLGSETDLPLSAWTRLSGLARHHHVALVCLTRRGARMVPLGSLVSLRGEGVCRRSAFDRFTWELEIIKDKRHRPGWRQVEVCRGPDGLC